MRKPYRIYKTARNLLILTALVAIPLLILCGQPKAEQTDPWYFQTDTHAGFMIPDKAQHFWGSYLLSAEVDPWLSLAAGLAWEIYQDRKGDHVSERDLLANLLGVIGGRLPAGRLSVLWNKTEENITVNYSLTF
jgi:hypothetical protein